MSLSLQQSNTDGRAALETQDGALIRGVMADVLQDLGELKLVLSTYPPEETEAVMQAIQEVRSNHFRLALNSSSQRNCTLQATTLPISTYYIMGCGSYTSCQTDCHRYPTVSFYHAHVIWRSRPNLIVTGQVTKSSEKSALAGGSNDIYRGQWLGRQEVGHAMPATVCAE